MNAAKNPKRAMPIASESRPSAVDAAMRQRKPRVRRQSVRSKCIGPFFRTNRDFDGSCLIGDLASMTAPASACRALRVKNRADRSLDLHQRLALMAGISAAFLANRHDVDLEPVSAAVRHECLECYIVTHDARRTLRSPSARNRECFVHHDVATAEWRCMRGSVRGRSRLVPFVGSCF
jgi:hypothetical protein